MSNPGLERKLRRAARKGRIDEIRQLLDAGTNIEACGGFFTLGQAPLACAVFNGQVEAVKYLLERGANPEGKDVIGDTTLFIAVTHDQLEIAKILIEAGADPRGRCDTPDRLAPLELAHHNKNVEMAVMLSNAIADRQRKDRLAREEARLDAEARQKQAKEAERAKDRDVVIVFSPLGDRTLEEIYNFVSLERISLIRQAEDGPVEAMTRQDFADICDKPGLRKAFAEHRRRGGTAEEKDVFSGSLQKIKPLQKDAP